MTSTTTRRATGQPVWPSRREREGGRRVRPDSAHLLPAAVVRVDGPASAVGVDGPGPAGAVVARGPGPAAPTRARHAAPEPTTVAATDLAVVSRPAPVPATQRVPFRPAPPSPCPPRPSVGSGVGRGVTETGPGHRVDGRNRLPRNGMGLAAWCLGLVALPLGLLPVTAFLAAGLGVLALVYGVAGWSRTRSGAATNRGSAVTGAVLGLVTLVIGVAGTIAFFHDPAQPVYDLNALTTFTIGE